MHPDTLEDIYIYGLDSEGTPTDRSSEKQDGRRLLAFFRIPSKIVIQLYKYRLDTVSKKLVLKEGEELSEVVVTDFGLKEVQEVDETMEVDPDQDNIVG